jgi:prevent-host-death family protein
MATHLEEPAMRVTATEAKNRFGSLCAQAKREPVFVEKAGRIDSVILSAEHYQALQSGAGNAAKASRRQAFEAEFADWIAEEHARHEAGGIPGADLRPW